MLKTIALGLIMLVVIGGCGGEPLGERWSMDWLGQCSGEMTAEAWTCGAQAGALTFDENRIDFGVAKAVVHAHGDALDGVVTTEAGTSCFHAERH